MTKHLLVFGPGYAASPIMNRAKAAGWWVTASYRSTGKKQLLEGAGFNSVHSDAGCLQSGLPVSHILASIAPGENGDPILANWSSWLRQQKTLSSLHYLSSSNIYGNHDGAWVDESTTPAPTLTRGVRRLAAEKAWQQLGNAMKRACFTYRLAGIYGPGRSSLNSLMRGKARRIIKPGQVFGRIHRADIEAAIWTAMNSTHPGGTFNLTDDLPSPPQDVVEAAAIMLGVPVPEGELLADADMSAMALSFYSENKRVKNDKIKKELGLELLYPTYKEGLEAIFKNLDTEQKV